jgi:hypothetical protein
MSRIVFLNTTILTADGNFSLKTTSLEEAKSIIGTETLSAIGHESTAQIMTELLGVPVPMNRIQYKQQQDDICICFKMNGRPAEGQILTREEIEAMGFEFKLLTMLQS